MRLVKTSIFSAIITIIKLSSGFIANKIIAMITGPVGVAVIGSFSNFITIALNFANGAINTGVVKYSSEFKREPEKLKILFSTALKISLFCSILIGFFLIVWAPFFSIMVFTMDKYTNAIRVLGITIIFYSLNSLLLSILNGLGQIKAYTTANTLGNIFGLILTLALVYLYNLQGALYALVLIQSVVFFITLYIIFQSSWFSWDYFKQSFDKITAIKLSHYSIMAIVSAITLPVSQIILRNILVERMGFDSAGYWQGMMKISDGYLMLITTSLGTYFLPKLSELNDDFEIKKEILNGYKIILPVVLFGCLFIYYFRVFIIEILYNDRFLEMQQLFFWQLIGDFFKIAAWILSYLLLAKTMTKIFIITEILFSISYVFFSIFFLNFFSLKGITIAFAVNYILYFLTMLFIFRKLLFIKPFSSN